MPLLPPINVNVTPQASGTALSIDWNMPNLTDIWTGVSITLTGTGAPPPSMWDVEGPALVQGLTPNTSYVCQVCSLGVDDNGDPEGPACAGLVTASTAKASGGGSGSGSGSGSGGGVPKATPDAPKNVVAVALSYDKAQVGWTPGANTSWVNISRKSYQSGNTETTWSHVPPNQGIQKDQPPTAPLLQSGSEYFYDVVAVNTDGNTNHTTSNPVTMPVQIVSLTLTPPTVVGGSASAMGEVTISAPAQAGGAAVALTSSDPAHAQVVENVVIAAGATTKGFSVGTSAVANMQQVEITATYNGVNAYAELLLLPLQLASLVIVPNNVIGGNSVTGYVALNGPAPPAGVIVTLSVNDVALANVPGTVPIRAGQTSSTFPINTIFVGSLPPSPPPVTINAMYAGTTISANLAVLPEGPPPIYLKNLTVSPSTIPGGGIARGTVTLDGPAPAQGITVALSAAPASLSVLNPPSGGQPSAVTVPPSVTVLSEQTATSFGIQTHPLTSGQTQTSVTIIAAAVEVHYALLTVTG